jgi:RNA polymerase sigma factor (sigma-70 family)
MRSSLGGVLSYLRRLAPEAAADDDGPLLSRFVQGDSAAFTILVGRHAPLVWGVCRRLLGPSPDAEDAFQATFVVLVEKAASLADGRPLGPWLHTVASRTAAKARARAAKRRAREANVEVEPAAEDPAPGHQREVGAILEEELGRLPEHYRRAVVLCYLEGLTNEEAARRLECPKGTVLSRLSRARERLRERLARRGLEPAGVALPGALASERAPEALVEAVAQAGPLLRVGAAAGLSGPAMTLAKGVVIGMLLRKVEVAGVVVLAMALMAGGAGWLNRGPGGGGAVAAAPAADEKTAPAKKTEEKKPEDKAPAADKPMQFDELRERLTSVVDFAGMDDPKVTLLEALDTLTKNYKITYDVNERAMKTEAPGVEVMATRVAEQPFPPIKAPLHVILDRLLSRAATPSGLTYLIRKGRVEITTRHAACDELNIPLDQLRTLVQQNFHQTELSEALKKIMEDSDVNIVLDPRALKERGNKAEITARLMNVPVETALKLLANMADLAVVQLDNVYYVTTPANAEKLSKDKPKDRRFVKPEPGA